MIRNRSTRLTQPQGLAEVDKRFGLVPAGLFVGSSGRIDAASGTPFSVGSAAAFGPGRLGVGAIQAAVNTGLYRPMPEVASATAYTAIWHGDVLGAPTGTAPEFLAIVNSATSQGAGVIGINRLTTTTLGVFARTGGTAVSRSGAYTWADAYGKTVTMVAVVNLAAGTVTLDICVGGVMRRVIDSTFTGGSGPTLTGTHQFVVGPDVIEIPTRHINSNVALAGAFYGAASDAGIKELLSNPWAIFKPGERRISAPAASVGGGGASQSLAITLDGVSAAVAQVAGRTQSLSASLDGVTFSAVQSVGGANSQILAVTLDGVQFAASQAIGHVQSAAVQLDDLTFSAAQSAANPVKGQSLAVTLDDLQFYATQEGPAVAQGNGFVLVDFEPRLWWKRKPKALDEQEAAEKIASVARQIERVAVKQVKAGRVVQPVVSKPAKAEILQAIAPQLQQMPGFDPVELYRAILERLIQQEQQRQAEQQAQQIAAQEIERIRLMELDEDETIILLMGA